MKLVALGIAGGLGPGAGTGLLQGMNLADQRQHQERQRNEAIQRQTYQQDRTDYEQQQRIFDGEAQRRQQILAQNLQSLRTIAPKVKSKAEYDQYVDAYASGLQSMGFRVNANLLRAAAPYVAPAAKDQAQKVFDAFLKNPANKAMLESHPEQLETVMVQFDRDGDGTAEQVPLKDLAAIAQMPFATGPDGKIVVFPKGTNADTKANADGILQTLVAQAKAEGKNTNDPKVMLGLQQQAIRSAAEAKPDTTDPVLEEMRQLRLQSMKAGATQGTLPAPIQRQVDTLSKGFDSQPAVKNTQLMSEAVGFAQSLDTNTKNPADDQALIYAFAKAMDPNSVVREGEYATVQKYSQSWAQTFGFNAARIFSNTAFLSPESRANMKATILAKFKAGQKQYETIRKSYVDRINRKTGRDDGEDYLTDYGGAFPQDTPPPPIDTSSARDKYRQRQQGAR